MITRRSFLKYTGGTVLTLFAADKLTGINPALADSLPGGTLDPVLIDKFCTPLLIPPVMPRAGSVRQKGGGEADYNEISMSQFRQQILPAGFPSTPVWGYGPVRTASTNGLRIHNAPSMTIEARCGVPVRVKWINELMNSEGDSCLTSLQ